MAVSSYVLIEVFPPYLSLLGVWLLYDTLLKAG